MFIPLVTKDYKWPSWLRAGGEVFMGIWIHSPGLNLKQRNFTYKVFPYMSSVVSYQFSPVSSREVWALEFSENKVS